MWETDTKINRTLNRSKLLISLPKMHTSPHEKKLIKFTRISRTVWTFVKKTEISQNTENSHPCIKLTCLVKLGD